MPTALAGKRMATWDMVAREGLPHSTSRCGAHTTAPRHARGIVRRCPASQTVCTHVHRLPEHLQRCLIQ